MLKKLRVQHYILFLAAVVGAVWFFIGYPSQDVRTAIGERLPQEKIKTKAVHQLEQLGFSQNNFKLYDVSLLFEKPLIDSLQKQVGRTKLIQTIGHHKNQNIKPYYWQVTFRKGEPSSFIISSKRSVSECTEGELCLKFDAKGRFIAIENPSDLVPVEKINPEALTAAFSATIDSLPKTFFTSLADTSLNPLFYFSLKQSSEPHEQSFEHLQFHLSHGIPYQYLKQNVRAMSAYYLGLTGWNLNNLKQDSLFTQNVDTVDAVGVRYRLKEPLLGQQLALTILISETGSLLSLQTDYNKRANKEYDIQFIWEFAKQILIILFGLSVFIVFFLRARSRAIDTRPAVVAAIIIGAVVGVYMILWALGPLGLLNVPYSTTLLIVSLIGMGLMIGIASVFAFILFGASDSIARQYWPQKIRCYDYIRQGLIFNKPVGASLLQSVALAFILAGVWTFLLYIFQNFYFTTQQIFISQSAAWPALRLLTHGAWFSFFVILSIFLVIGVRTYSYCKKYSWTAIPVIIAAGIIVAPLFNYGPFWLEFISSALLGGVLYLIFLKWDFLTTLLSYFLFSCLIGSVSGWIVPNSPDIVVFVWVIIVFVILAATGIFAVIYGEDEQKLVNYVPDYVEEHANEERIKQELKIARNVQQTFLPEGTPKVKILDIAAACIPANETGGDYYDFIHLDDHRIAVTIGDVSGKGIQAAFYMTFIKGLLHGLSGEKKYSPVEVLKQTNRYFYDNAAKSTFISLIYGVIDLQKMTFTFARAGHNPIIHLNSKKEKIDELRPNGLGIGLTNKEIFDNKINEIELNITGSDLFLLYTDGVTEALNEMHQFYGTERLTNLIAKHKEESSSDLISIITKEVKTFIATAEQHDDMTIMAIQFDELNND